MISPAQFWKSMRFAARGLWMVFRAEQNFRIQLIVFIVARSRCQPWPKYGHRNTPPVYCGVAKVTNGIRL